MSWRKWCQPITFTHTNTKTNTNTANSQCWWTMSYQGSQLDMQGLQMHDRQQQAER